MGRRQAWTAVILGIAAVPLLAGVVRSYAPGLRPDGAELRGAAFTEPLHESARLDVNTASAEELEALPGIGPALAERILARRAELGGFLGAGDLLSVEGIGEGTLEGLLPHITF